MVAHIPTTVMSAPYFFAKAAVVAAACYKIRKKSEQITEIQTEFRHPPSKELETVHKSTILL